MKNKTQKSSLKNILDFISEAGMLKRVTRSGWSVLGIKNAESVAEHSFRCAVIGYVLANMEKVTAYKVLLMTLFGDLQEARITDLHKMAQFYFDLPAAEDKAFTAQIQSLPKKIKKELTAIRKEYNEQKTKESIIARDADILECLIQAKEYQEQGFLAAKKFMQKAPRCLETKSARKLYKTARDISLCDWWMKLSVFKR